MLRPAAPELLLGAEAAQLQHHSAVCMADKVPSSCMAVIRMVLWGLCWWSCAPQMCQLGSPLAQAPLCHDFYPRTQWHLVSKVQQHCWKTQPCRHCSVICTPSTSTQAAPFARCIQTIPGLLLAWDSWFHHVPVHVKIVCMEVAPGISPDCIIHLICSDSIMVHSWLYVWVFSGCLTGCWSDWF